MTATYVLDASVAVKWVLNETGRRAALRILEGYRQGRSNLAAPSLLISEVGNVLWKKAHRGDLSPEQSLRAFGLFLRLAPTLLDDDAVAASALRLAQSHGRTFYDSQYLALALSLNCPLLTADAKLYNALHNVYPASLILVQDS